MRIVVLGLGYVGAVCAACLSRDGHEVIGIDVNEGKVQAIEGGRSPVIESGLDGLLREGKRKGRLRASTVIDAGAREADVFLITVGTPQAQNGASDLSYLLRALTQLGDALRGIKQYQVVNVRSTVPPGTIRGKVIPLLEERTGRKVGEGLGVAMNPEFLREGSSIEDYDSAPFDLCGAVDARAGATVQKLYASKGRAFHLTTLETAELVKYVNNAFHALKVSFANEIGRIAKTVGVDSLEVMRLLCNDRRLNISPAYLRPGMAFGGSCLGKDLWALVHEARRADMQVPLLETILQSNETHLQAAVERVLSHGRTETAILGLSFKAGTDDLRDSPMVRVVERLLGKGVPLRIYDRNVNLASLVGSNREFIEREIPHIGRLLVPDLQSAIVGSKVVVVGSDDPEMEIVPTLLTENQILIDFFGRLAGNRDVVAEGICW